MTVKSVLAVAIVGTAAALVAFRPSVHDAEVRRIQTHFDGVLVEMRARDVTALTPEQRARRSMLVDTLVAYRNRALFPQNYDFDAPTPYFVDPNSGVLCAVGHLLASTGRRDIVDRVSAADNNVRVPQLAGDTAFMAWLGAHGLTLAEAARIQPMYGPTPRVAEVRSEAGSRAVLALAGAATTINLVTNRAGTGSFRNAFGIGTGLLAMGYGMFVFRNPDASGSLAIANIAVGGLGTLIAARNIARRSPREPTPAEPRVAVAPLIPTDRSGAGLMVRARF